METPPLAPRRQFDRQRSVEIVTENARLQATSENRENYFKSCEAHGPDLADVVTEVRSIFNKASA